MRSSWSSTLPSRKPRLARRSYELAAPTIGELMPGSPGALQSLGGVRLTASFLTLLASVIAGACNSGSPDDGALGSGGGRPRSAPAPPWAYLFATGDNVVIRVTYPSGAIRWA
jgi:hypothetical protein